MENLTELCRIAYQYGTDKCPQIKHFYTPYYYELLKKKVLSIKKVLEIGIGYYDTMKHSGKSHQAGASLFMWRDFFPNAMIYGADIKEDIIFEDYRIKTYLCDETKEEDIKNLIDQTGSDIDLFIDDGSHDWHHQAFLAKTVLPLLKKDVIYIIEDVGFPLHIMEELKDYECSVPRLHYKKNRKNHIPKDRLLLVKNK